MKVALVNTNSMKPPIAPIGLEYVAETMRSFGYTPRILDLSFDDNPVAALERFFSNESYDIVGLTFRNTDDCAFTSRCSFISKFHSLVASVRNQTDALIVVGGVGFSVMPETILTGSKADVGVWSDGEFVLQELASRMERKEEWKDLENLIVSESGVWRRNSSVLHAPESLPSFKRNLFDNARYFREGGQAGFETKRGCNRNCIYCADPAAKGKHIRTRHPSSVVYELSALLDQGIDVFHTCDSEFNIPPGHALSICEEMIKNGLGRKIHWYAYCAPAPFTRGLAKLMRRSGCIGINFGADSGDREMLRRLGRDFGPEEIVEAVKLCRDEGIIGMIDLLVGGPGESRESITRSLELVKSAGPDRIGINVGVRVYPGTPLSEMVKISNEGLVGGEDPEEPLFYLELGVANDVFSIIHRLTENDERFLFFDPSRPDENYNYNDNQRLVEAIAAGHRGAFWDILRKVREDEKRSMER
jgi:radical SAM superfamily enzyme YgiQ (UPF0313 family)